MKPYQWSFERNKNPYMSMFLTIIIEKEQAKQIKEQAIRLFSRKGFVMKECNEEIYWKNDGMANIRIELDTDQSLLKAEWVQLFHEFSKHNSIFRDQDFLEIAHFSSPDSSNEPFIVFYVPIDLVK